MKYKQTSISGESYKRSNKIEVINDLNTPPRIFFHEEKIFNYGDDIAKIQEGLCAETLTAENHEETFALRDPQTGDLLGATATYAQFAAMLYSLYWHVAEKRDNPPVEEE